MKVVRQEALIDQCPGEMRPATEWQAPVLGGICAFSRRSPSGAVLMFIGT